MLIQDDVTDVLGMAWNENGVATDFETNGDYAAQFNAIRSAFGETDVITDLTDNTVTFLDAGGNSVLLSFDNENKRFIPIVSAIENGTPNMFIRTLNDGNSDVTFVCDADGKVCYFGNGYLLLVNDDVITQSSDGALLNRLYTACGGSTEITNHVSADGDYYKYTNGDFSFVTNAIGGVTFGEVNIWPGQEYTLEIYADEECTQRPSGTTNKVYAKLNKTISVPKIWIQNRVYVNGPDGDQAPWTIVWYTDWNSEAISGETLQAGVYELTSVAAYPVEGNEVNFI